MTLQIITGTMISIIGREAIHRTLKKAILSNTSIITVSSNNQSNDTNTPDDPPTCEAEENKEVMYVGNSRLNAKAAAKICK